MPRYPWSSFSWFDQFLFQYCQYCQKCRPADVNMLQDAQCGDLEQLLLWLSENPLKGVLLLQVCTCASSRRELLAEPTKHLYWYINYYFQLSDLQKRCHISSIKPIKVMLSQKPRYMMIENVLRGQGWYYIGFYLLIYQISWPKISGPRAFFAFSDSPL